MKVIETRKQCTENNYLSTGYETTFLIKQKQRYEALGALFPYNAMSANIHIVQTRGRINFECS